MHDVYRYIEGMGGGEKKSRARPGRREGEGLLLLHSAGPVAAAELADFRELTAAAAAASLTVD